VNTFLSNALDAAVVPGFSKIGFAVRKRLGNWRPVSGFDLRGKTVVITGPTSGLGEQVARQLAPTGANLVLVARNEEKCARVIDQIAPLCTGNRPIFVLAEMGDLDSVRSACAGIQQQFTHIDALIHNAGALLNTRQLSPQGIEQTVASHVVGPFLMTTLLLPLLKGGRVVTVSSGGMYTSALPAFDKGETLEMPAHKYGGSKQYAIAKRAQVTLTEMWATHSLWLRISLSFHQVTPLIPRAKTCCKSKCHTFKPRNTTGEYSGWTAKSCSTTNGKILPLVSIRMSTC
jgi:NAD(P)-dependent dehydrogenase (short-subunit alcohol dehydrogenase family)